MFATVKRRLLLLTIALFVLGPDPGRAEPLAPQVTVNGEQITFSTVQPERTQGDYYLPALPIAEALQLELSYDPTDLTVDVVDPVRGIYASYHGTTGQVWRNGVMEMVLPPGAATGGDLRDLQITLSLVALLFEVETFISPDATEIALTSRERGSLGTQERISPIRLQEIRYRGYANDYEDQQAADLGIHARTRIGYGRLETSLDLRGRDRAGGEHRKANAGQNGSRQSDEMTW